MLKVLICDDDQYTLKVLEKVVSDIECVAEIFTATNGQEAVNIGIEKHIDLAILDIDMPVLDGIEAAKQLTQMYPKLKLIFATAYTDYAYESYTVNAVDYILKPIDFTILKSHIEKIFEELDSVVFESLVVDSGLFVVKHGSDYVFLNMDDINFIEKDKKQLLIHCKQGVYETNMRLLDVESKLKKNFYRTHKSYIVNLKNVDHMEPYGDTSYVVYFKEGDEMSTALITKNKLKIFKY